MSHGIPAARDGHRSRGNGGCPWAASVVVMSARCSTAWPYAWQRGTNAGISNGLPLNVPEPVDVSISCPAMAIRSFACRSAAARSVASGGNSSGSACATIVATPFSVAR